MNSIDVACEVEEDNSHEAEVVVIKPQKKRGRPEGSADNEGPEKYKKQRGNTRRKSDSEEDKIPLPIVFNMWGKIVDRQENALNLMCENEYGVYIEDDKGARTPVRVNTFFRTIERVTTDTIVGDMLRTSRHIVNRCVPDEVDYALTPRKAVECALNWTQTAALVFQDLPVVSFRSEGGFAFSRLEFDPWSFVENLESAPAYAEIGARMENFEAFCAWIWSLFVPTSDRRQYIWLHGDGQTGKSQIAEALSRVLGGAVTTANPKVCQRDNWTYSLLSKRLCVLTEANPEFPLSDMFKSITGDERHRVNEKYLKPFDATIDTKFLFISNDELSITSDRAAMSRAILCHLRPFKGEMLSPQEYQELLATEMPIFLGYCKYMYEKINRKGSIPSDTGELEALAEEREYKFHSIFEQHFIHKPGSRERVKDLWVVVTTRAGLSEKEYKTFKKWMERTLGITCGSVWLNGKNVKCFVNVSIRGRASYGPPLKDSEGNLIKIELLDASKLKQ